MAVVRGRAARPCRGRCCVPIGRFGRRCSGGAVSKLSKPVRWALTGTIASAGFASGDRIVIGHWTDSPLGAFSDVMWARPDGERVLLAPDQPVATFITALYDFDRVEIVPVKAGAGDRWLELEAGPVEVQLKAAAGVRVPVPRPPWVTRFVEAPIARALLGVQVYGTTASGVREWYRTDEHRRVVTGWATADGRDLGAIGPIAPPVRFGFSEPPRRPSIVAVRPLLQEPAGPRHPGVPPAPPGRGAVAGHPAGAPPCP